ncbi:MAG: serine/threonine-protein kinase [Pseudomonadota bacterium]|nr:serine/threonine-protein kinase [Pseudomonadota bacterium]
MTTPPLTIDDGAATARAGSEHCLPIGTRLADFEITGVLGEGGFGIVYIAYDHALQRSVAIKEYMPDALAMRGGGHSVSLRAERHQATFELGLKSFINEARFLAQFDHPALLKVYSFWEQNRTAYTAMQYYEGRTIKEIVANSPELVDEAWCRKILRQMLQALEMLYTANILHRDVSPDNIIVQPNGDAVLLDFGSARQIIGDLTRGLTVILKPGYAPVEQYAGDASLEQGAFTDIYALAAVMYFAVTKRAPPSSIARMIKDPLTPLTTLAPPGYHPSFLAAIDKGLAVLAHDRPQTIAAFRDLLGIVSLGPPPAARSGARGAPPAPPERAPMPLPVAAPAAATAPPPAAGMAAAPPGRRWQFIAIALAVLLTGGIGLYALVNSAADDTIMLALPQSPRTTRAAAPPANEQDEPEVPAAVAPPQAPQSPQPAPQAAAPVVEMMAYRLAIKPWGTVYVDGRERGVSPPMKRLSLTPGKHRIRIANPNFPDVSINVDASKDRSGGTIEHDFTQAKR